MQEADLAALLAKVSHGPILLQKSKVAGRKIFRENTTQRANLAGKIIAISIADRFEITSDRSDRALLFGSTRVSGPT
ncbi:hypothetical protein [Bradyrhizobium sp. B117]|uniref:hypothetical protein n=1 Tax=Bradyrhizobium sp. B117 TaxID=3140246 RepID=UPI003182D918